MAEVRQPGGALGEHLHVPVPKRRYIDVCNLPTGGSQYNITQAGLNRLKEASELGLGLGQMARLLGIAPGTFRELRKRDERVNDSIAEGREELSQEIQSRLVEAMRDGNITAMIFLGKARCGWVEGAPPPGTTINNTVNINIPAAMSDEEFDRFVNAKEIDHEPIEPGS